MIFVALAVAWALYLIPKALSHHDEMAKTRSIESFSDSVRVLGKKAAARASAPAAGATTPAPTPAAARTAAGHARGPVSAPVSGPVSAPVFGPVSRPLSRAAAKRAAARRRRVLAVLLLATVVTTGLATFAVTPWWSVGVPAGAVMVFLVVARLTVRREQAARRPAPATVVATGPASGPATSTAAGTAADAGREDTTEVPLAQRVAEVAMPLEDEGSLWDPLPMTLPTYVNKARARRTVRTIELTQVASSGHDAADSALVAQAAEAEAAAGSEEPPAEERKVAGA